MNDIFVLTPQLGTAAARGAHCVWAETAAAMPMARMMLRRFILSDILSVQQIINIEIQNGQVFQSLRSEDGRERVGLKHLYPTHTWM